MEKYFDLVHLWFRFWIRIISYCQPKKDLDVPFNYSLSEKQHLWVLIYATFFDQIEQVEYTSMNNKHQVLNSDLGCKE